ncbi:MAG: hypothetical protein IJZ42_12045 [Lachnospiraceae bacterium]|nr:hypothetical protein [Lachnospiraceae bacterium]
MNKSVIMKWFRLGTMAVVAGAFAVQVVYAVIWAIQNGNNVQDFYDSAVYISGASTMQSDQWRLIGYSFFLKVFLWLGEHYAVPVYLVQVIVGVLCFTQAIRSIYKMFSGQTISALKALPASVYIITIPIIWQMQFAILPDSLCLSLIVLLLSGVIETWCTKDARIWKNIVMMAVTLLFLGVLERHYFYAGIFLVCMNIFARIILFVKKKYRTKMNTILILCMMIAVLVTSLSATTINRSVPQKEGYASYSMEADLWKRFVYPNIVEDYPHYTERITAIMPEYVAHICGEHYEYYMNSVVPMFEHFNPEEAESICFEVARIGFALHRQEFVESAVKEGIAYACMPLSMVKYMYNNSDSLYGHNFSKMYEMCPRLTADYMHIGMNGLLIVSVLGLLVLVTDVSHDKKGRRRKILTTLYCAVAIVCVTVPIMFFSFAKFDYRIGLFSTFIWATLALITYLKRPSVFDNMEIKNGKYRTNNEWG